MPSSVADVRERRARRQPDDHVQLARRRAARGGRPPWRPPGASRWSPPRPGPGDGSPAATARTAAPAPRRSCRAAPGRRRPGRRSRRTSGAAASPSSRMPMVGRSGTQLPDQREPTTRQPLVQEAHVGGQPRVRGQQSPRRRPRSPRRAGPARRPAAPRGRRARRHGAGRWRCGSSAHRRVVPPTRPTDRHVAAVDGATVAAILRAARISADPRTVSLRQASVVVPMIDSS